MRARFDDAVRRTASGRPCFVGFLNEHGVALLRPLARHVEKGGVRVIFWGGSENCERLLAGVFYDEEREDGQLRAEFPVTALKIVKKDASAQLCHRDYLGALLALGISRDKTGDIFVGEDGALLMCDPQIAVFVISELKTVGKCAVGVDFGDEKCYNRTDNRVLCEISVSSARLDAVLAPLLHLSRGRVQELIRGGGVFVNGCRQLHTDAVLKCADTFSATGYGKYRFESAEVRGKKGRLHIVVTIYG